MGQCGATVISENAILWTHPNFPLVVAGREPNDSRYYEMLFCFVSLSSFYKLLVKYITSLTT